MSFCERMAPQTMAASYQMSAAARPVVDCAFQAEHTIHMPPCAIAAVPPSGWLASPLRPRSGSSSLCPRGAAATLAGTPVADAIVNSGVCVTVCDAEACTLQ